VSLYPAVLFPASPADEAGWQPGPGDARMIAIRLADLRSPARHGSGKDGRTALTAGAGPVRSGDLVVFCKPVAVAPALVRRDGRVQAAGHPADHVRLGVVEQQLDEMTGVEDTIGQVAAQVTLRGAVKGTARRAMSIAAALRGSLLMTLMPDADHAEILAALFGDLAAVPWQAPFTVPTGTVFSAWRKAAGPEPLAVLQDLVLAASAAGHEQHDWRAIVIGDLKLGSVDGTVTRMPDTKANRAVFGSAAGDDVSPYPQLRDLLVTDASTRGTLAVVTGPSGGDKAEAEQQLLDRALTEYGHVFTKDRIWVLDRNFPGVARIKKMTKVTHVLIRLRSSITLRRVSGFFPTAPGWLMSAAAARRSGCGSSSTTSPSTARTCRRRSAWPPTCSTGLPIPLPCWPRRTSGAGTGRRPRCGRTSPPSAAPGRRPGRSSGPAPRR
jgi:hypothetical protein